MRERLNAEGHDESQYLPQVFNKVTCKMENMPPVNPWRERKGDVRRNSDDKLQCMSWLPDILFDRKKITKPHLDTANSFFRILVHAKRTLGICALRGALFDRAPVGVSDDIDAFLAIMRGVAKPESNALIWFVWDDYNRGNIALAEKIIGTIQHALENAQNCIDNLRTSGKG